MSQKVWVIDDQSWNTNQEKRRMETPPPERRPTQSQPLPEAPQKSPALSFSLSLLVWGGGQIYLGKYRPGSVYLAAMFFFFSLASALVVFRDSLGRVAAELKIQPSAFVSVVVASFLIALVVFLGNAVAAYYRTVRSRSEPFQGVDNELWPLLGSLLFPGWGQFLNGQPKKGLFFFLFGAAGVFSAFVLLAFRYLWPLLEAGQARHVFEICLASALVLIPVSFLMWIVSAYDALRSHRVLLRKRLSLKNAGYRAGSRWSLRGLIPRSSAVLGLLLAISLGMQFLPRNYYLDSLEKIRTEMMNRHMQVMPDLVERAIRIVDR